MTATFSISISGKAGCQPSARVGSPSQALHALHASGLVGTTRNLASFASGAARVLVATDIAARGIHVDGIPLVIRADPPAEHKAYLHRSGRTAQVGAAGVVITVQTSAQAADVRALMGRAGVVPLATRVSPGSALLAAPRAASETALTARPATGRGAVAMSGGYRGRRRC